MGDRQLSRRAKPFSLLTFDFSRVPSIMEERASTYQALFFRSLQIEGVFPDSNTVPVIPIRHLDAQWKDDLSDLPPACRDDKGLRSPEAVMERIEIPTPHPSSIMLQGRGRELASSSSAGRNQICRESRDG